MAMYGLDVEIISRMKNKSVSKTAAYILRENIYDDYSKETHYYSHYRDCLYKEVILPDNAPREFRFVTTLLHEIDRAEKRYDARTGRAVRLSLPNDKALSDNDRIQLARRYVREAFVSRGMCAIMAIHTGLHTDPSQHNPHAHILLTDRPVDENGFCAKKDRDWNRTSNIHIWRKLWAEMQNELFREKGLELSVSHESLEVQGIDREPTVPLGRAATALERKGILTERGNINREIAARRREQEEERIRQRERHRNRDRSR